jgi:hypothetical protein
MSNADTIALAVRLSKLGFEASEISALRRIARALHRWCELECGSSDNLSSWMIERDDETEKPFFVRHYHSGHPQYIRTPIQDKEASSLKRLEAIMDAHPRLTYYYQTDPRGASLYILTKTELDGKQISSVYTRGVAVY